MPKTEIQSVEALRQLIGKEVAVSDWMPITQERIDRFAEATGDFQWIHVDPVRAAAESPFGATIAHGYLTLSLIPLLMGESMAMPKARMGVNYGLNRLRFSAPVRSGASIRARFSLIALEDIAGGIQTTWQALIEIEGSDKPACVAELIFRQYS